MNKFGQMPAYKQLYRHQQDMTRHGSIASGVGPDASQPTAALPHVNLVTDPVLSVSSALTQHAQDLAAAGEAMIRDNQLPQTATEVAQLQAARDERLAAYNYGTVENIGPQVVPIQPPEQIQQRPFAHNDPMATVPGGFGMPGPVKPPGG